MSYIEKEKLIKADIASIENRVRHAFNQGYDLGYKEGKERAKAQEPSTKNDLGVERQIKEICISYPKSDLKEHDGQPYYSVKYIENDEEYEGYGTYKIEVFMEYLRNYFMPSVTPQNQVYPLCEDCHTKMDEVRRAYDNAMKQELIIDKIRAEITDCLKALDEIEKSGLNIYLSNEISGRRLTYQQCLKFIDKYKAEIEPQEREDKE